MSRLVTLTLIEKSNRQKEPKAFPDQRVDIDFGETTYHRSVDGPVSHARHPTRIFWHGGKRAMLDGVTHVRIVARGGDVLIDDWEFPTNRVPRDIDSGLEFFVLHPG
jgi:hypothetical protein